MGSIEYFTCGTDLEKSLGPAELSLGQSPSLGPKGAAMPLYMDTHRNVADLTAEAVQGAHKADLATQEKYGVDYKQYWYNEDAGAVYCLVEAPNAEAAAAVHKEAHGLVADDLVEVHEGH